MKTQTNGAGKDPRLVARVDTETQQFIARAAELSGVTMSQFLIDSARSKAEEVVDRITRIQVSVETGHRMMEILDRKPRKPSSKLMQDALDYKESVNDIGATNESHADPETP
tara:strand:+ start:4153 stop:4488 length:336 start_codon:yes stop_codon:yes gene_type:complete